MTDDADSMDDIVFAARGRSRPPKDFLETSWTQDAKVTGNESDASHGSNLEYWSWPKKPSQGKARPFKGKEAQLAGLGQYPMLQREDQIEVKQPVGTTTTRQTMISAMDKYVSQVVGPYSKTLVDALGYETLDMLLHCHSTDRKGSNKVDDLGTIESFFRTMSLLFHSARSRLDAAIAHFAHISKSHARERRLSLLYALLDHVAAGNPIETFQASVLATTKGMAPEKSYARLKDSQGGQTGTQMGDVPSSLARKVNEEIMTARLQSSTLATSTARAHLTPSGSSTGIHTAMTMLRNSHRSRGTSGTAQRLQPGKDGRVVQPQRTHVVRDKESIRQTKANEVLRSSDDADMDSGQPSTSRFANMETVESGDKEGSDLHNQFGPERVCMSKSEPTSMATESTPHDLSFDSVQERDLHLKNADESLLGLQRAKSSVVSTTAASGPSLGQTEVTLEAFLYPDIDIAHEADWTRVQALLPESWRWDVEYQAGCWNCTPLETQSTEQIPLTIGGAPVVLPVEYSWPPTAGVNPPPDPRPSASIDCRGELSLDVVKDIFLTYEGIVGFYLLINGLLQVIVPGDFDITWASSHLPHKFGSLKVCYIPQSMEATMLPSFTLSGTRPSSNSPTASFSSVFRPSRTPSARSNTTLKLNDFIEARPRSNHRKEKYAGRIGMKVAKGGEHYLLMSTHIITEAILAKSHRDALFGRDRCKKLDEDWNQHVEIWAGNERLGNIEKTFDTQADVYPNGFNHDLTLIKPTSAASIKDVRCPLTDVGWLNRESWNSLRQQTSPVKILGPTESHRSAKTIRNSRPSEILIIGQGILLNQAAAAPSSSKPLRDHDASTWNTLVSRALLYRVYPDFDPPNGYSGVALFADGTREDGTAGAGIAGFQSFVQRSVQVQNYEMEGPALDRRVQLGRVAFYGAFEVPGEVRREYVVV